MAIKWQRRHNFPTWHYCQFFDVVLFLFSSAVSGAKFHVNIITGSRFMLIFFYKGLTTNPEIGSTPVWVSPNIWRLGRVRDTKFGINVSNKMLLNAAKCPGYSFYYFWFIKENPTGGRKIVIIGRYLVLLEIKYLLYYERVYSETSNTSKIKLFVNIINGFTKFTIFGKSSICDV